jgi:hypothetical protein
MQGRNDQNMKKRNLLFIVLILVSCDSIYKRIPGFWVVDQAYYNGKPITWDLYTNGFALKEDNTCILPIGDLNHRGTNKQNGTWQLKDEGNTKYLKIITTNDLFNRTFEITKINKVHDPISLGFFLKMTLRSDSLTLNCSSAY